MKYNVDRKKKNRRVTEKMRENVMLKEMQTKEDKKYEKVGYLIHPAAAYLTEHAKTDGKKENVEFRYYEMPQGMPMLPLLGEKWITRYGSDAMHFHNYLELGYCYSGRGIMHFGDDCVPYRSGSVVVIPRNFPHRTEGADNNLQKWEYLYVDSDNFLKEQFPGQPELTEQLIRRLHSRMFVITKEMNQAIGKRMLLLLDELREEQELYLPVVKADLLSLLLAIIRCNPGERMIEPMTYHNRYLSDILRVVEYIDANYREEIHIEDLTEISQMSETHFRRKFTEYMKITPGDYINLLRIKKACELLRYTECSIGEAGAAAGFRTDSAFIRNFRKFVGMTPREWRKQKGKEIDNPMNYNISVLKGW